MPEGMSKRRWPGLSEKYLQSALAAAVTLDRAFYQEHVWWWETILSGEWIGTGDAESGMSLVELESYKDTIFRYEFNARMSGEYAHGKPWAWLDFDSKFGFVSESGEIDQSVYDYRDFVEHTGRTNVSSEPPQDGWSGRLGFCFRLDTPTKTIVERIEEMLERERAKYGVYPTKKSPGRPPEKHPWDTLKLMDEISNRHCRGAAFVNDTKGNVSRLIDAMKRRA
jgi:hypothetical protein